MANNSQRENPIVRGELPRRVWGAEAKRRVRREIHGVVVSVEGGAKIAATCSASGAPWWYDLRKIKRHGLAEALRVVDVLVASGASVERCEYPGEVLKAYARDQVAERDANRFPRRVA